MEKKIVKLNYSKLNKLDICILKEIALSILTTINKNNKIYNEEKYGSIKDMKSWTKHKYIKWLNKFNPKVSQDNNYKINS